jgi:hypothetical protein
MGLVASGSAAKVFLQRLPSLHAKLGPVKSVSWGVARRLVLSLRHGFAIPNYSALEFCPVIWVAVPKADLDATLHALAAQTSLRKAMVVICESERDSHEFPFLEAGGAKVATLNSVDDGRTSPFVAEGNSEALRFLGKLLQADRRKLIELAPGAKASYFAGIHLVTELLRVSFTSSLRCLQAAGLPRNEAVDLVTNLSVRSLKAHARAGTKPWSRSQLEELRHALDHRTVALRETHPLDSAVYANALRLALDYFEHLNPRPKARHQHA